MCCALRILFSIFESFYLYICLITCSC
uniref:Uncharacterized protein n=1 Tax=Rhizophora mucronata TaxID=61149 RepID=A0A2P2PHJ4_RHIMU